MLRVPPSLPDCLTPRAHVAARLAAVGAFELHGNGTQCDVDPSDHEKLDHVESGRSRYDYLSGVSFNHPRKKTNNTRGHWRRNIVRLVSEPRPREFPLRMLSVHRSFPPSPSDQASPNGCSYYC